MTSSKKQKRSEFVDRLLALPPLDHGAFAGPSEEPSDTAMTAARRMVGSLAQARTRTLASKLDLLRKADAGATARRPVKAHG